MRASEICAKAAELTRGDREKQHGPKTRNHQNIANLWNAYLRNAGLLADQRELGPQDVALMMALLKIARTQAGSYNLDDYTDLAGYAGVAGEIAGIVGSYAET